MQVHPEVRIALMAVDGAGLIALLAIVVGGVPFLYVVIRNAFRDRRWRLLGLLALPLIAVAALASGAWTQRATNGTPEAPFSPLALGLQLGLVLLLFAVVGSSTVTVALAVSRSHVSNRLLRFALIPATVVTLGIMAGLVATIVLTVFILTEAPQLASPSMILLIVILMAAAAVLAFIALQRGMRAIRQQVT